MPYYEPYYKPYHKTYYIWGRIEFKEPAIRNWIRRHGSFASYEWFKGRIRYREWLPDSNKPNHFYLLEHEIDGVKPIRVIIKFIYYPNSHVYVYHAHVL